MIKRSRGLRPSLLVLGLAMAAAAGSTFAVLALPPAQPSALASSTPASAAPVSERSDVDQREVQLALTTGGPRVVSSPRPGKLTGLVCAAGRTVESGSVVAWVDGVPVIALATGTPLWRNLVIGDTGDDVRGFQTELARLGHPVVVDGIVGPDTLRAARAFVAAVANTTPRSDGPSLTDVASAVPVDLFTWLPSPSAVAQRCDGVVGSSVVPDTPLVSLPTDLVGAQLAQVPQDAAAGARNIRVGSVEVPVDERGAVTDTGVLDQLAASPEYSEAASDVEGEVSLAAEWILREPESVLVVPPTSLYAEHDGTACLQVPKRSDPLRVEIVGSDLGQSFVRASPTVSFRSVVTAPDTRRPCR